VVQHKMEGSVSFTILRLYIIHRLTKLTRLHQVATGYQFLQGHPPKSILLALL